MKAARETWFDQFARVRVNQLIFLDEFGASTTMQRTNGRAAPGERVVTREPHGYWKIISTIAAMNLKGIMASVSFDGGTDTELFRHIRPRGAGAGDQARAGLGSGSSAGTLVAAYCYFG